MIGPNLSEWALKKRSLVIFLMIMMVVAKLLPAPAGHGLKFRRMDLEDQPFEEHGLVAGREAVLGVVVRAVPLVTGGDGAVGVGRDGHGGTVGERCPATRVHRRSPPAA